MPVSCSSSSARTDASAGAGAERARAGPGARAGCEHIAIFGSATETFAQKNLNRSLDEQFAMFEPTVTRARAAGLDVRAYVSMCFGDPWEGAVPVDQVVGVGRRLFDLGASQLSLGDTIGVGTAGDVRDPARRVQRGRPGRRRPGRALPRHLRPGARQRVRRAAARGPDLRRQRRRTGRLPVRRERDRQPRDRGPGLDVPRPRGRDRGRPGRAGRDEHLDGRGARQAEPVAGRHRASATERCPSALAGRLAARQELAVDVPADLPGT